MVKHTQGDEKHIERREERERKKRKKRRRGRKRGREGREKDYRTQKELKFDSAVLKIYSSFYFIIWM